LKCKGKVNSDPLGRASLVSRIHVLSVTTSFVLIGGLDFDGHRATGLVEIDGPG